MQLHNLWQITTGITHALGNITVYIQLTDLYWLKGTRLGQYLTFIHLKYLNVKGSINRSINYVLGVYIGTCPGKRACQISETVPIRIKLQLLSI